MYGFKQEKKSLPAVYMAIQPVQLPASIEEEVVIIQDCAPSVRSTTPPLIKQKYCEANRIAQKKYREKYPEKYCAIQKKLYDRKKLEPEWIEHFNERARGYAKKAYDLKRQAKIDAGEVIKGRGRPRKVIEKLEI